MSNIVKREVLLTQLESIMSGVVKRETVEQSSCFIFSDGYVRTFNEEVACFSAVSLKLTAAVPAEPLVALLRKLPDDEITVEVAESELILRGKAGTARLTFEAAIKSPVANITPPDEWNDLNPNFINALQSVQNCVSSDESKFAITCVHVHTNWVEATDRVQIARHRVKTGFAEPVLIRAAAIKAVVSQDMAQYAETDEWAWFRNPRGLIIAARRYVEPYPDLTPHLEIEDASPAVLPKSLGEIAERCSIFSAIGTIENKLRIVLKPGKMVVVGEGAIGSYSERRKIEYSGRPLEFTMSPEVLPKIVKNGNNCEISDGKLRITEGKFQFVTCLSTPSKKEEA